MGCQASPSRMVGQPRNLGKCRHMNDSVIPERGFDNEGNSRACAAVHTPDQSSGKLTDSDIEGPSSAQGTKEQLHMGAHHSQTLEPQDTPVISVVSDTPMARWPCKEHCCVQYCDAIEDYGACQHCLMSACMHMY